MRMFDALVTSAQLDGQGSNAAEPKEGLEAQQLDPSTDRYHQLALSAERILWIDDLQAFNNFLLDINQVAACTVRLYNSLAGFV